MSVFEVGSGDILVTVLVFALIVINILMLKFPFVLMRFVFAVVSLVICGLAIGYAGVPFSPYLQLLGVLVSVLCMLFATFQRG